MNYVRYDTQSPTGLKTWVETLQGLIHVAISVFDPSFRPVVAAGGGDTQAQAREWCSRQKQRGAHYPDIRLVGDGTAEVIGEVLSEETTIGYIVLSRFYFDEIANPHIKQFRDGMPVYDESLLKDAIVLISFGVRSCLREIVTVEPDFLQKLDAYIVENLRGKISLLAASRALGADGNTLRFVLQAEFGCGLADYVRMKRLEETKRLLSFTDLPPSEVAQAVGMEEGRLSRLFEKTFSSSFEKFRRSSRA